ADDPSEPAAVATAPRAAQPSGARAVHGLRRLRGQRQAERAGAARRGHRRVDVRSPDRHARRSTMIRAALIGLGWWGGELAVAADRLRGRLRIAACASLSAGETRAFAARIGARPLDGYEAALAAP